jgi:hypothetical protein
VALYRIYVHRNGALRCLPGEYKTTAAARLNFEKDHGDTEWCLIGYIDPSTERPAFLLRGQVLPGGEVEWKQLHPPKAPKTQ